MPNTPGRDKKTGSQVRRSAASRTAPPRSTGDLLTKLRGNLGGLHAKAAKQADWRDFVISHLEPTLAPRVTGVAHKGPVLTIFMSSAAWAARLRFSLNSLEAAVRERDAAVQTIQVKVSPPITSTSR